MALSHSCLAPSGGCFTLSIRPSVMSSPYSVSVPLAFVYPDWDLRNPILNRVLGREIRQTSPWIGFSDDRPARIRGRAGRGCSPESGPFSPWEWRGSTTFLVADHRGQSHRCECAYGVPRTLTFAYHLVEASAPLGNQPVTHLLEGVCVQALYTHYREEDVDRAPRQVPLRFLYP